MPSHVAMPAEIARSHTSQLLLEPATVHPYADNAEGLARLSGALAAEERAYGTIYFPDADALMHMAGPDAPEVAALIEEHLSAIASAPWPEGTLVLLTADHGMEGISPERTTYVNVAWPELAQHMVLGADGKPLAPAGSCRDLFLHVRPERLDEVEALLDDGLFGSSVTEALTSRLANLVVLPAPGHAAYWLEPGRFEQTFLGQHGGLTANEVEIPLVSWIAGG